MAPPITLDIMTFLLGRSNAGEHQVAGMKISCRSGDNKATLHRQNGSKYALPDPAVCTHPAIKPIRRP